MTVGPVSTPDAPASGSVAKNTIGTLGASGVYLVCITVASVITARMLGVDGRGEVAAVTLLPMIVAYAGELGLPIATGYLVSSHAFDRATTIATARMLGLILSTILTILGVGLSLVAPLTSTSSVLSAGFCLFVSLNVFQRIGLAILQAELRMKAFNLVRLAGAGVYVTILCGLYVTGYGSPATVIAALLAGNAFWCVASIALTASRPAFAFDRSVAKAVVRYGVRAHPGNVSSLETLRIDQLLLALFLSTTELGLYIAAMTLVTANRVIGVSTGTIAFPLAARRPAERDGKDISKARSRIIWLLAATGALSVLVAALELFAAPQILRIMFGPDFVTAASGLRVLAVASIFMNLRHLSGAWILGRGKPSLTMLAEIVSVLALTVSAWWLWDGGILAIAWAVLISATMSFLTLVGIYVFLTAERYNYARRAVRSAASARPDWTFAFIAVIGVIVGYGIEQLPLSSTGFLLIMASVWFASPIIVRACQHNLSFLDPIVPISVCFLVIFAVRPAWHLFSGDYLYLGHSIEPGFHRALLVGVLGFGGVVLGYVCPLGKLLASHRRRRIVTMDPARLTAAALTTLCIAVALFTLFIVQSGLGLRGYVSGRSLGQGDALRSSSAYLYYAPYVAIPVALLLIAYPLQRSSFVSRVTITLAVLMVLLNSLGRGNRIWLLPLLGGFAIWKARTSARRTIAIVALLAVPLVIGAASLRESRFEESGRSFSEVARAFAGAPGRAVVSTISSGDLAMFDALALEMQAVPTNYDHQRLIVPVSLVSRSIPRALWPSKPLSADDYLNSRMFPYQYRASAWLPTYSALGEAYLDSGMLGVVLMMTLFGVLARSAQVWFARNREDKLVFLVYSMGLILILVYMRGSAADTFGRSLFLIAPFFILERLGSARLAQRRSSNPTPSTLSMRIAARQHTA